MSINIKKILQEKREQPKIQAEMEARQKEEIEEQISSLEEEPQENFDKVIQEEADKPLPSPQAKQYPEEQPRQEQEMIDLNIEFIFVGYIKEAYSVRLPATEENINSFLNAVRQLVEGRKTIKIGDIIINSNNVLSFKLL